MNNILLNELFVNIQKLGFKVESIRYKSNKEDINNKIVNIHSAAKTITSKPVPARFERTNNQFFS